MIYSAHKVTEVKKVPPSETLRALPPLRTLLRLLRAVVPLPLIVLCCLSGAAATAAASPALRTNAAALQSKQTDSSQFFFKRKAYTYVFGIPQSLYWPTPMTGQIMLDSADLLIEEARLHLGKPYHYGSRGPKAFDCAGFAHYVYKQFGFSLPGGSATQYHLGTPIKDRKQLQKGDLVFFQGRSGKGGVGHTGIVCEVDTASGVFRFIHAATSTGVIYSYSTEPYYASRYIGARRLLGKRQKAEDPLPRRRKH